MKNHFPYPYNRLNEGDTSLEDTQPLSPILDTDASLLNGGPITEPIPVITEPERRFTAPSIGGGGDILDRSQEEQDKYLKADIAPVKQQATPNTANRGASEKDMIEHAHVGTLDVRALRQRLAAEAIQGQGPMHVDGRTPGQVPSVSARPHIPAGAKPSKLAEMHRQFGTER